MRIIRASILAFTIIMCATIMTKSQQKVAAPSTQAQLQEQIDELKKRLDETQQTAATAKLANEYAQKTEDDAKSYYDKVLATETRSLWIMGILITALLALAARIGFTTFERLTQSAIREATTQLRSETATTTAQLRTDTAVALGTEVETLKKANAADMQELREELVKRMTDLDRLAEARASYWQALTTSDALAEPQPTEASITMSRFAIVTYKEHKGEPGFTEQLGALAIRQTIVYIRAYSPQHFADQVRNELRQNHELYKSLERETTEVLLKYEQLLPVLQEWREGRLKPVPATIRQGLPPMSPAESD